MAARRQSAPAKSLAPFVVMAAAAGVGAGVYYGAPGMLAVWLGLIVIGWTEPPVALTGKSRTSTYPIPASPGEAAAYRKWQFWNSMKWKPLTPSSDWMPGTDVLASFIGAVIGGFAAYFLPVHDPSFAWVNALAVYVTVMQVCASRRQTAVDGDVSPGVRVSSLISVARKHPNKVVALMTLGVVAGVAAGIAGTLYLPEVYPEAPLLVMWTVVLTGFPLLTLSKMWVDEALTEWREVCNAREGWAPKWQMLRVDPEPRMIAHKVIDNFLVDTFDAQGATNAEVFLAMAKKLAPTIGAGFRVAVLETPNMTVKGEPIPGSMHPNRFQIVVVPSDGIPDLTDPSLDTEVATLTVRCAMAWAMDDLGFGRPVLASLSLASVRPPAPVQKKTDDHPIDTVMNPDAVVMLDEDESEEHEGGSPAAWKSVWHQGTGPGIKVLRENARGLLSGSLDVEVLIDHRYNDGEGVVLLGVLTDESVVFEPDAGITSELIQNINTEDVWVSRWFDVLKSGANPPKINHKNYQEAQLADGNIIRRQPFLVSNGMSPADYYGLEPKLATALSAARFVHVGAYLDPAKSGRSVERHAQAFCVYWSNAAIAANPDRVAPARGLGPQWVIAGQISQAFKAAKLPLPEVANARALTHPSSAGHIWRVELRLYDGVTLSAVRLAADKLRTSLGSQFLRVTDSPDGCVIVVGANPEGVKLLKPKEDGEYLVKLDWDKAWLDSKVTGVDGLLPKLVNVDHMRHSQQVQVLDFDLPSGLDFTRMKAARPALMTATGLGFIEVNRIADTPGSVRVLACPVNPMPASAPYQWEIIDSSNSMPFATNVEGEPVGFEPKDDPHLLVVGASGSGKSVILQSLIYSALVRGYDLYLADPVKGAADFRFAEPYAKVFTGDLLEARDMMVAVYAEVVRRKNINAKHGVGNYRELPEDIRPPHAVVVLDEFTSLCSPDMLPPVSDDPDLEDERDLVLKINTAKLMIGSIAGKLVREARSAGFTVILATQKMTVDLAKSLGGPDLKTNMSKLLAGKTGQGDRMSALNDWESAPDLGDVIPAGRAIFESKVSACKVVQCWYEPGGQTKLSEMLSERRSELLPSEKTALGGKAAHNSKTAKTPASKEPVVVDLGEVELSMADFADFLDDDTDFPELPESASTAGTDFDWSVDDTEMAQASGAGTDFWSELSDEEEVPDFVSELEVIDHDPDFMDEPLEPLYSGSSAASVEENALIQSVEDLNAADEDDEEQAAEPPKVAEPVSTTGPTRQRNEPNPFAADTRNRKDRNPFAETGRRVPRTSRNPFA